MSTNQGMFRDQTGRSLAFTFILVSSLFLLWGLCNGMIDVMDKHFQQELNLSKSQSAWVQFAHYLGYFLMSLPAGWLATRLGYKGGLIAGLLLVAAGGFWFLPATKINSLVHANQVSATAGFIAYLAGVCVIASGLTFLETIANPYTTVLGNPRYAATRINLAQSCNGVGWICGPLVGGLFFYGTDAAGHSTGSQTLYIPYVAVGVVVLVLAIIFYFAEVPDIKTEDDYHLDDSTPNTSHSIWAHSHFTLAVIAQFLYVAAQAGIFSFFINYMTSELPVPVSDQRAATLQSLALVCFLIGRFTGSGLLRRFSAHKMLGLYGLMNVLVCFLIFLKLGWFSVVCVFLSYFFMSIMFPTIFALGIFGLGARAKKASAFIVMAIMGGAILPKLMGYVADTSNMSRSFIVPMFCFAFVAFYGFNWSRFSKAESLTGVTAAGH